MILVLILLTTLAALAIARAVASIHSDGYGGDAHLPRSHDYDSGTARIL